MRIALLLPALATLAAAPLAAQSGRLPAHCRADLESRPGQAERRALRTAIQDSLRTEMAAAAREAGVAEPAGLVLVILGDRATGAAQATTFQGNVPDAPIAAVVAARAPLLARWPEAHPWLHVRLDGPHPAPDARMECLPAPLNGGAFVRSLQRIFRNARPVQGHEQMSVRMLVSRAGDVVFATIVRRGPSVATDRAVVEAARTLRFRPATIGGVPVDAWVEQPVLF